MGITISIFYPMKMLSVDREHLASIQLRFAMARKSPREKVALNPLSSSLTLHLTVVRQVVHSSLHTSFYLL